jgi:hypothetical protein
MCDHHEHHDHDEHEHPKDRALEQDDPMLLVASQIDGDPLVMIDCLIEEYARMGCDADEILGLFLNPTFQATAGLMRFFGRDAVEERIRQTLSRCGVMRFRSVEAEPDPEALMLDRETPVNITVRGGAPRAASCEETNHG